MTFSGDLRAFAAKVEKRQKDIFVGCSNTVRDSIKQGSPLTNSVGQPVDTGYLMESWILRSPTEWASEITTNVAYAPAIEEGQRAAYDPAGEDRPPEWDARSTGKSERGGRGSVKLTRAGWQNIVDSVVREVVHD